MENRIELAEYFAKQGFKVGAEVGVADGRYSEILCQKIPNLKLYCIDPWSVYPGNWRSEEDQSVAFKIAQDRLKKYPVEFIKMTSLEASINIEESSLDFVFIDGAHDFNNVMLDIILWTPKVKEGGIVSLHDYYQSNHGTVQVIPAVDAYCKNNGIRFNVIPRATKVHRDDRVPCVWWIKK